jgi:CRISPR-associated protein Cmr2
MTDAILVFTFSPIQPFIAEARRAGDLYAGSHILSELAKAAAQAIGPENLIYPDKGSLDRDVPNKLVARTPYSQAEALAGQAKESLLTEWQRFVIEAHRYLMSLQPYPDSIWQKIWQRQINSYWECYWAYAPYDGQDYGVAYKIASRALDAAKRTRCFTQPSEPEDGLKDTLSGHRSALRLQQANARKYWGQIAALNNLPSKLRPKGKERLDALGAIKRFGLTEETLETFLSVSSVAAADFLEAAKQHPVELELYRQTVENLLGPHLYKPRPNEKDWPYDGDLFFLETLTANRLEDSYNLVSPDLNLLQSAQDGLNKLHRKVVRWPPRPYYALLLMDGDGMGEVVDEVAKLGEQAHQIFSQNLSRFASQAKIIVEGKQGVCIYSGGDDVLAMAPISTVLTLARALREKFYQEVYKKLPDNIKKPGVGTASAGIAIVHHLYPLNAALEAARAAEKAAKQVRGKTAVAVHALKRSGGTLVVRSKWEHIPDIWYTLITYFQQENSPLSSRFAYSVASEARIVTCLDEAAQKATLRRLIGRHRAKRLTEDKTKELEEMGGKFAEWARQLDQDIPPENVEDQEVSQGFTELSRWLLLAQFMAQRGGD